MEEREIARLLRRGQQHLEHGSALAAMEAFRQLLSIDPEHVEGHAALALALYEARRLHACEIEASRALVGDPESPIAHLATAYAAYGARRWEDARRHLEAAVGFAPHDPFILTCAAELWRGMGEPGEAQKHAEQALEVEPAAPAALVLLGRLALARGDGAAALEHASAALALDPGHGAAQVLRGWLHLHEGQIEDAREHAIAALREDPTSAEALRLLVAIKMRQSLVTGLWYRFNSFIVGGSRARAVGWLVALYLVKGLLVQVFRDLELRAIADALSWAWLGFCVYTWFGPAAFRRALQKEIQGVELDEDF